MDTTSVTPTSTRVTPRRVSVSPTSTTVTPRRVSVSPTSTTVTPRRVSVSPTPGNPTPLPAALLAIAAAGPSCFSLPVHLHEQLAALPPSTLDHLAARGFDARKLEAWATTIGVDRDRRNRLPGLVEPPYPGDILEVPDAASAAYAELCERAFSALAKGEVALCLLAGGMATRMGGVVKALVEALPGHTFLDLRLGENALAARLAGTPLPLWMMTSEATHGPIGEALAARGAGEHIATFEQFVGLRLTPEGGLFLDEEGHPSAYSTGHGDLPDALRASGLLDRFVAGGGKTVWIANIDNLGATVDPAILGLHLAHGGPLTVELVDKLGTDRGGAPFRWNGRRIITEEFRLPLGFDPTRVPVFNTNTFLVDARALASLAMDWTYVEVEKKIGDRRAVQFERILGEITVTLEPQLLRVPRAGGASRFLPVKDLPELERRRPEIELIARERGMIPAPRPA
jgi:UTP--glucose-1-phosphate uridylyltransferase